MLYCGFFLLVAPYINLKARPKYKILILLNLVSAFGMLIAFTIQGYKFFSIAFSMLSIITAFFFTAFFIADAKKSRHNMQQNPGQKQLLF